VTVMCWTVGGAAKAKDRPSAGATA
jgi:hypothetical protein